MRYVKKITIVLRFLVLAAMSAPSSHGAELHLEPSLTLSEEYNDNILLQEDNEIEEYITRVILGLELDYSSLRSDIKILYAPEYRYFANYDDYGEDGDEDEIVNYLDAEGNYILINKLLFIKASDVYERVPLTTTRDFSRLSLFLNQSDRNTATLNPYFSIRPTPSFDTDIGYTYIDIWYDKDEGIDRIDNIAYVNMKYDVSSNTTLHAGYKFTMEEYETGSNATNYEKQDAFIGVTYEYREGSFLSLRAGYSVLDYDEGNRYNYPFWNTGITHQFSSLVTSLNTYRDLSANPTGDSQVVDSYRLTLRSLTYRAFSDNPDNIFYPESIETGRSPAVDRGRTTFSLSFYLNGFTNTVPEDIEKIEYGTDYDTVTYGTAASLYHLFSANTMGNIDFTAEMEEEKDPDTYTSLYLAGARLIYFLTRNINLVLVYAYTDSYSPDIELNNYQNTRIIASIKKTF